MGSPIKLLSINSQDNPLVSKFLLIVIIQSSEVTFKDSAKDEILPEQLKPSHAAEGVNEAASSIEMTHVFLIISTPLHY